MTGSSSTSSSDRLDERILAFLAFRPQLLHALDGKRPAWPSPRSWVMASALLRAGLGIAPAVGEAAATEFEGFCSVYEMLPELESILESSAVAPHGEDGSVDASKLEWPAEPSACYALTLGLANRARDARRAINGFRWLAARATPEWLHLYTTDVAMRLRANGSFGALTILARSEPAFAAFHAEYSNLTGHGRPADRLGAQIEDGDVTLAGHS